MSPWSNPVQVKEADERGVLRDGDFEDACGCGAAGETQPGGRDRQIAELREQVRGLPPRPRGGCHNEQSEESARLRAALRRLGKRADKR